MSRIIIRERGRGRRPRLRLHPRVDREAAAELGDRGAGGALGGGVVLAVPGQALEHVGDEATRPPNSERAPAAASRWKGRGS